MARPKNDGRGRIAGGRKKGTPNKVTKERRELISEFLNENWDDFKQNYKNADPPTKLKIYMEMIPYTTPKMASIEVPAKSAVRTLDDELAEISGEKNRK
jgi:hypothetical protein